MRHRLAGLGKIVSLQLYGKTVDTRKKNHPDKTSTSRSFKKRHHSRHTYSYEHFIQRTVNFYHGIQMCFCPQTCSPLSVKVKESGHDRDIFVLKNSFKASCHDLFARGHLKSTTRLFFIRTRSFLGVTIHFGCTFVVSRTITKPGFFWRPK